MDADAVFRTLISAFDSGDRPGMAATLAADVVATVTNAQGGADLVHGREAYLARMPDVVGAEYAVLVGQTLMVAPDQVLAMVEVRATRKGRTLHNHAAFLATAVADELTEIWMVDALPADSDAFWS